MGAADALQLDSNGKLRVELPLEVPVKLPGGGNSHPYRSARLPLLLSSLSFPLARRSDRVELVELAVAVVIALPHDRDVYRGRLAVDANDERDGLSFSLTFSLAA